MLDKNFSFLIKKIKKKGYTFYTFDQLPKKRKVFYLRFDVDISPYNALSLGIFLWKKNIKANFFFQINSETYNCFSKDIIQIIKRLKKMSHCVGLHVDEYLIKNEQIKDTINWFSTNITNIDDVVSFHRPSRKVLGKKFKNFVNTYDKQFFNEDIYLSDSRNNKEFINRLNYLMDNNENKIQLLLHPEWWTKFQSEKKIYREIIKRKEIELIEYLSQNFKKVFSKFNKKKKNRKKII